jgi:general secretion pathway protein K
MARLYLQFPTGAAVVEVIPETAKLSLNQAPPAELNSLLINLGAPPQKAQEIVAAIVDWRTPGPPGPFDQFYSTVAPSFRARHASFEELEELLLVKGMTPELFYGSFTRDSQGRLIPIPGLRSCVSVYNGVGPVDANTAEPAVLATIGVPPPSIAAIVDRRRSAPFKNSGELQSTIPAGPASGRLAVGGNTVYTLRSTAQIRLPDGRFSDLRRTVGAVIKLREAGSFPPVETLRWYDNY